VSIQIITTADGSNSLLNVSLNETYHSIHGAIQESLHVFIQNGLLPFLHDDRKEISVLEVGFGTGLNALLTMQCADQLKMKVSYNTIEPYPLPENVWTLLNYPETLNLAKEYRALHKASWQVGTSLSPYFKILKLQSLLQETDLGTAEFDIIYYDAFAPPKQPDLWVLNVLQKVVTTLKPGGALVTYCAKGQVKRDLKSLQMTVEALPGPPGKKEMIRAIKN
jgi:tRNA U34 5-methylaminomethyl-2-thiouridine-forming methyltransferase MnmC